MDQYKIAAPSSKHPLYQNQTRNTSKAVRRPVANALGYQLKSRASHPETINHQKIANNQAGKVAPKQRLRVATGLTTSKKNVKEE